MDLATFCAGVQVSAEARARTASGADALATLRIPDPGMEHFYRRLLGALLARTEATQPSPRLPSIMRAMTWDFVARTTGPGDITLWFGCDSPIAAAAPLLCSGSIPSREDTNVSIVFGGYREFKRDVQVSPIPFDPEDGFTSQHETWARLRPTGGRLYCVAYSAALPVDLMAKSFSHLVEVSGPPVLLLLDTFASADLGTLEELQVQGWRSETIVERTFSTEQDGEAWRILALRFTET